MPSQRTIDHVGIVVDDLEAAITRFTQILGAGPEMMRDMPKVGLRVAMFKAANIRLELLHYTMRDGFAEKVMGEDVGLNHIGIASDDLAGECNRLSEVGLVAQDGFPREGAHGQVLFFERDPGTGILFELCSPPLVSHD